MPARAPHPASDRKSWPPEKLAAARKIEMLMAFWQIRPAELRAAAPGPADATASVPAAAALAGGPKYRHPVSGETWDGQGSQPEWLRHALLKEGLRPEDMRVSATPAEDGAA